MKITFEYVSFFALLAVLSASLFVFRSDLQIVNLVLGALIGVFTSPYVSQNKKGDE